MTKTFIINSTKSFENLKLDEFKNYDSISTSSIPNNYMMMDQHAITLAEMIKASSTIRSIDLKKNLITNEGAIALAKAIEASNTIKFINLNDNWIGAPGILALETALKMNITITEAIFYYVFSPSSPEWELVLNTETYSQWQESDNIKPYLERNQKIQKDVQKICEFLNDSTSKTLDIDFSKYDDPVFWLMQLTSDTQNILKKKLKQLVLNKLSDNMLTSVQAIDFDDLLTFVSSDMETLDDIQVQKEERLEKIMQEKASEIMSILFPEKISKILDINKIKNTLETFHLLASKSDKIDLYGALDNHALIYHLGLHHDDVFIKLLRDIKTYIHYNEIHKARIKDDSPTYYITALAILDVIEKSDNINVAAFENSFSRDTEYPLYILAERESAAEKSLSQLTDDYDTHKDFADNVIGDTE